MFSKTMIMYCYKMDQLFNIFISNFCVYILMTESSWKCFRCNLSFKEKDVAEIHKKISNHSVTKVKTLAA